MNHQREPDDISEGLQGTRQSGIAAPGDEIVLSAGSIAIQTVSNFSRGMNRPYRNDNFEAAPPPREDSMYSTMEAAAMMPTTLARGGGANQPLRTAAPRLVATANKSGTESITGNAAAMPTTFNPHVDQQQPGAYAMNVIALGARRRPLRTMLSAVFGRSPSPRQSRRSGVFHPFGQADQPPQPDEGIIPESSQEGLQSRDATDTSTRVSPQRSQRSPFFRAFERDEELMEERVRKPIYLIFIVGCLLLVIVVGVTVGVTLSKKDGGDNKALTPGQSSPTSSLPIPTDIASLRSKLKVLTRDQSLFETTESPQSLAISWLAEEDDSGLDWEDQDRLEIRYALAVFYFSTKGPAWNSNLNFLNSTGVCEWNQADGQGIGCDSDGNVQSLTIRENNLRGAIPEEIKVLLSLEKIQITGQTFAELELQGLYRVDRLGQLENVQFLDLSGNGLGGQLPDDFALMLNLKELYLNGNRFEGTIPLNYEDLTEMRVLHLHDNKLEGDANRGTYNMTSLEELRLDGNNLVLQRFYLINFPLMKSVNMTSVSWKGDAWNSTFPRGLSRLNGIEAFHWDDGQIFGTLPAGLVSLTNLHTLSLRNNVLSGTVPWGNIGPNLRRLDISDNRMTGRVSSVDIEALTAMDQLHLEGNSLTGNLDSICGNSTSFPLISIGCDSALVCSCCEKCR